MTQRPIKLNLGCGYRKLTDYINLDIDPKYGPDVACDLERGLPFMDRCVDEIQAVHILEHIGEGFIHLMREIARVGKPDAWVYIRSPYYLGAGAWGDPTHRRAFSETTFQYFCEFEFGADYGIAGLFRMGNQKYNQDLIEVILYVNAAD